jgi:flagellar biosynthesis activator protein FlaF
MTVPAKGYQRTPEPGNPARSEAWALLEAARQLNATKNGPVDDFRSALRANWRLWTIFQASLTEDDCPLPTEVRGNLLGLANLIDRLSVELLSKTDVSKVDTLVHINRQISEGLLEGARATAARNVDPAPVTAAQVVTADSSTSVRRTA